MPGPQAAQNLQMPHPQDWQMPCSSPGGSWAQMELTDALIINILKSIHFLISLNDIIAWFICSREYEVKLLINIFKHNFKSLLAKHLITSCYKVT